MGTSSSSSAVFWRRRLLKALVFFVLAAAGVIGWTALFGIPIDLGSQRDAVTRLLSQRTGRAVRIDGALQLRIGLRPQLQIGELRIAQPDGFGPGDFLRIGAAELKLDLIPLLRRQLRADRLSARDVRLELQQREDGAGNWAFTPSDTPAATAQAGDGLHAADAAGIDIRDIDLDNITVVYRSGMAAPREFHLDRLDAALPIGAGVKLRASGRVERTMPYALSVDGGELRALLRGQQGWPVTLQLDFAGGRLVAQGRLGGQDSEVTFGLGAPDLAQFGKVIGVPLPNAGAAGLSGTVLAGPGVVRINGLSGSLGKSVMAGWLEFDARGSRPRLAGALGVQTLDLRPFLGQNDDEEPADLAALYRSLSQARVDLQVLKEFDADLQLGVGQWLGLPGDIRGASLQFLLREGRLGIPVEAIVEQVPMKGRLDIDAGRQSLALRFGAADSPIGGLARFLAGIPGIEGQLGRLQLEVTASGTRGDALMRSLSTSMRVTQSRLSYGNREGKATHAAHAATARAPEQGGARPVDFTLDRMQFRVGGTQALAGELKGSLLGKPLEATLSGDSLMAMMAKGGSPVALTVQTGRIAARVSGTLNGADQSADLMFSLGAERAGDVGTWLGLNPRSTLPIAVAGRVRGTAERWALSNLVFQVGDSSLYSDVAQDTVDRRQRLKASLEIASVNIAQLDGLLPPPAPARPGQRASLDIPLLPARLVLEDADVRVRVRDIRGTQIALGDMGFDGRVRDGHMQSSPFFADIAGTRYQGAVALDLRQAEPHAQFWLSAAAVDIGLVLRQLKLAKDLDAGVERLNLYIDSRSARLASLMANALVSAEVSGGRLVLRDPNTRSQLQVALSTGSLSARPGERVALQLSGAIDQLPVEVRMRSATMKDLADPARRVPFELNVDAAQTQLQLSGSVDRDIDAHDADLALEVHGPRLDTLDKLLRLSLPPWGPWSAVGRFRMSARGYAVDDLKLQIGSSQLHGHGTMDTARGRPKLDVALSAPLVQLDDFRTEGWSALGSKAPPATAPADAKTDPQAVRRKAAEASDKAQALLSRENLSKADATLTVNVDQVKSGADVLGQGRLQARLADGRAEVGPVQLTMPGGRADWRLSYEPRERDVLAALKIDIDNFDYGVISRRIRPDSDLDGRFSFYMDVNSRAPQLSQLLAHGSGSIDVAVWPRQLRSGIFDLWAVNLFVALLPTLDPKNESVVNCAVGRFALNEGKLRQKQLLIDTSGMRVTGTASVDFGAETLHLRMQPQAKTAQFLSLATPIEVDGSFSQFNVGPNPGDVLQTVVRLATSIVWVPLKKLFGERTPADGADVCKIVLKPAREGSASGSR